MEQNSQFENSPVPTAVKVNNYLELEPREVSQDSPAPPRVMPIIPPLLIPKREALIIEESSILLSSPQNSVDQPLPATSSVLLKNSNKDKIKIIKEKMKQKKVENWNFNEKSTTNHPQEQQSIKSFSSGSSPLSSYSPLNSPNQPQMDQQIEQSWEDSPIRSQQTDWTPSTFMILSSPASTNLLEKYVHGWHVRKLYYSKYGQTLKNEIRVRNFRRII